MVKNFHPSLPPPKQLQAGALIYGCACLQPGVSSRRVFRRDLCAIPSPDHALDPRAPVDCSKLAGILIFDKFTWSSGSLSPLLQWPGSSGAYDSADKSL